LVKIRLQRVGAKNQPEYRIVVANSTSPRDGRFVDIIGYYHPVAKGSQYTVNESAALDWLKKGAQPSPTVKDILKKVGVWIKYSSKEKVAQ